jgi:hypothetical protein
MFRIAISAASLCAVFAFAPVVNFAHAGDGYYGGYPSNPYAYPGQGYPGYGYPAYGNGPCCGAVYQPAPVVVVPAPAPVVVAATAPVAIVAAPYGWFDPRPMPDGYGSVVSSVRAGCPQTRW